MRNFPLMYFIAMAFASTIYGLETVTGQHTWVGTLAGAWLLAQVLGLVLYKFKIGIAESQFWDFWSDASDGGIDNPMRRRLAWFFHGVLVHFSMLQYDLGVAATIVRKPPE
ncbi:hypothetical protein GCM10027277_57550 [Pseudoduganella ginsengisoli]|uniref:Uncharacterized protein n=1 Tax=Pseudoduganella ginsengisoli TaxID=1462440 RepID=A0A6L6Q8D0_9BURK|nr:hypothetical protein [Pseudoduganella ginsengisoli]MTW05880.1 hypothetical protein [Pseudoduganella ginsengisoli]